MSDEPGTQPPRESHSLFALLFGLRARVDRRTYAIAGFGLMFAKYALDAALVKLVTGANWTPLDYLSPLLTTRQQTLRGHGTFQFAMALWTLPFLWIGLTMSMRRALDAGIHASVGLVLYFVPFLNYAWMLLLCALPSAPAQSAPARAGSHSLLLRATGAMLAAVAIVAVLFMFSVYMLKSYGTMLFIGSPVLLGALSTYLYDRGEQRPWNECLAVGAGSVLVAGGALLLSAAEGLICLAMALPIAVPMGLVGALVGRRLAGNGKRKWAATALLPLGVTGTTWLEAALTEPVACSVTTVVEVDAPREVVWRHVVSFSELPPATWAPFRLGLAHPLRATIDGRGVGAVRRCEFSTGAFVEPITAWEEPGRLAFDVAEQPPPMHELSFFDDVQPPHLEGYISSQRGEFRLIELPAGRTRLEGTTWYELRFAPAQYWRLWSDLILHRIHGEVLAHVAQLAESEAR